MSQHDYSLANQAGAAFRADANDALAAIVTNNSGTTEPTTTFSYMWWADTTTGILKQRNAANNAWINILTLATGLPYLRNTGFLAHNNNVDITTIATDTPTKITFSTESYDTNSEFSSGTFTAKIAGLHRFYFQWAASSPLAGNAQYAYIYLNGALEAQGNLVYQSGGREITSVEKTLNLSVGNTVEAWVLHNRGTNEDLLGGSTISYFCGGYIGG